MISTLAGEYGIKMTNEAEKLLEIKDPDTLTALRIFGFAYYYISILPITTLKNLNYYE